MEVPPKGGGCVRLGLTLDCRAELRSPEELVALAFNQAGTSWACVPPWDKPVACDQDYQAVCILLFCVCVCDIFTHGELRPEKEGRVFGRAGRTFICLSLPCQYVGQTALF